SPGHVTAEEGHAAQGVERSGDADTVSQFLPHRQAFRADRFGRFVLLEAPEHLAQHPLQMRRGGMLIVELPGNRPSLAEEAPRGGIDAPKVRAASHSKERIELARSVTQLLIESAALGEEGGGGLAVVQLP